VDRDVQLPEPVADLLAATTSVTPGWLRRITVQAASAGGVDTSAFGDQLDVLVASESERLVGQLRQLLSSDVDDQRTNPLSLFRAAVGAPTEFLRSIGVPPPPLDHFAAERFPDDVYRIGPAAWSDIDPSLHEPGLVWGAWKAMTVLRRRRDEGRR
jgi:hypothetical protein